MAFPQPVLDYWNRTFWLDPTATRGDMALSISATLNPTRPAMILETTDGMVRAVVRPEIAEQWGAAASDIGSADDLKAWLRRAGVTLHDPDYLFYLTASERIEPIAATTPRRLTEDDRAVFDIFYDTASEQDREDAWVEWDHWAVFGYVDHDRLVSAASMNVWPDSAIADLGVLTLPDARGKGFARAVVAAINHFSRHHGYEPQYRCQTDNLASVALARSCGLTLFGRWIVATDTPDP